MLSRVGSLALSAQVNRRPNLVKAIGNVTIASVVTGLSVYHCNRTKLDGALALEGSANLVVPTIEAAVRGLRLISTAILIVADYETAKVNAKLFPGRNSERSRLEAEKLRRRQQLVDAQIAYTSSKPDELVAQSGLTRQEFVRAQKEAVHRAAESLAEAENEILALGDKDSVHEKAAARLLHCVAPTAASYSDVCRVIEEDLGKHPDELFDSFEPHPIASASLAQVHVAYEKGTGRKLAIKCQHRGLRETSSGDVLAVTFVIRALERMFEGFTWGWIADEIAPHLPKELDFLNEGKNAERAEKFIRASGLDCVVPRVLWEHSSSRVLCMEFEEGFNATDLDAIEKAGLNKRDIATLISSVFSSQVFAAHSPIHVDPHPANVLIRAKHGKPQMVLVDHGLYKDIDDDFRICYAKLWQSLMLADLNGIRQACTMLGVEEMHSLLAAMLTSRPYDEIMERSKSGSLSTKIKDANSDKAMITGYAQHYLKDIIAILGTLPRQMLLLLKMNDCLRHIDHVLGSPTNTLVITGKYASRAIYLDTVSKNGSWVERMSSWLCYMKVLFRIQAHDFGLWWMETQLSWHQMIVG
ncbi:ABC1 family-like protein [Fragilaria crotonensis]|nr:ABC1 family-like protein [Fragilaria crotonensis]